LLLDDFGVLTSFEYRRSCILAWLPGGDNTSLGLPALCPVLPGQNNTVRIIPAPGATELMVVMLGAVLLCPRRVVDGGLTPGGLVKKLEIGDAARWTSIWRKLQLLEEVEQGRGLIADLGRLSFVLVTRLQIKDHDRASAFEKGSRESLDLKG
jgi:hypothetical protein